MFFFHRYWCIFLVLSEFTTIRLRSNCANVVKNIKALTDRCTQLFYLQRLLKVTGSNIEHEIVAHPDELRRNRQRRNARTDVDTLFQYLPDL